jgi:predicted HTH domain antitoxin
MAVSFELPRQIEENLRHELGDLNQAAKEAALVELYRQHRLTHHELSEALGVSRFETDGLLKSHGVSCGISVDEVGRESGSLGATAGP